VKTNIKSSKINSNNPLNIKQVSSSRTLKQCQSVELSYNLIAGLKRIALFTALVLGLISKPYFAHAGENAVTSNLQAVAELYTDEIYDVLAEEHWTRIEFSTIYIDPVVVVEGSGTNDNNTYVVGIRNVDEMGFEISLKNCNNSTDIPVQENISYAIIEKSELPSTEDSNTDVRQQFSWGECATTVTEIMTGEIS
jgi:hypothetical protein